MQLAISLPRFTYNVKRLRDSAILVQFPEKCIICVDLFDAVAFGYGTVSRGFDSQQLFRVSVRDQFMSIQVPYNTITRDISITYSKIEAAFSFMVK